MYYSNCFTDCKVDHRKTWSLIREVSSSNKVQKDSLPDWFGVNNEIIRDSQEIANHFNTFITEAGPKLAAEISKSSVSFTHFLGKPNNTNF